jgi:uncharacterized phage protein gp47/JayE
MVSEQSLRTQAAESEFGIQTDGEFQAPHLEDILSRMAEEMEKNIPQVDMSPGSPDRQLLEVFALEAEALWESQRSLYYSAFFSDSFGKHLDRILALAGINRRVRQGAGGEVKISVTTETANKRYRIDAGTVVVAPATSDSPPIPFKTTEPATIDPGEAAVTRVPIKALEPYETDLEEKYLGKETNVPADTITAFRSPHANLEVTNPLATGSSGERSDGSSYSFVEGRDRETDPELKERYRKSLGLGGKASLQALQAAAFDVDGVDNATIDENPSPNDNTGSGGLPPHSFRITALSDTSYSDDIAQAIAETRSAGIQSHGEYSGTATVLGDTVSESFDLASIQTIYVDATITTEDGFPDDGKQQIKDAIITYIGGETTSGEQRTGTDIGENIAYSKVLSVSHLRGEGVFEADVELGTASNDVNRQNIPISDTVVAQTSPSSIDVTTTPADSSQTS